MTQHTTPPKDDPNAERLESRRIPPHGDVSPDGLRVWPRPSRPARWLVWGGVAIASAALTAGTVLAARRLGGALSGGHHPRPDRPDPPRDRARPGRSAPRPGLAQEIEANAASLANSVEDVMQTLTAAVSGVQSVSAQASAVARGLGLGPDLLRQIFDRGPADAGPRGAPPLPDLRRDPLLHDPLAGPPAPGPQDDEPRLHRL